jgi:hypothetical protein
MVRGCRVRKGKACTPKERLLPQHFKGIRPKINVWNLREYLLACGMGLFMVLLRVPSGNEIGSRCEGHTSAVPSG